MVSLKQARLLSELSQRAVAEKIGVHRQTYIKWEKNPDAVPVKFAKELSAVFGKGVDEIFFDTESTLSR